MSSGARVEAVEQEQFLTFHLAGEEYAVSVLKAKEIIEYGALTKVPGTPRSIRGVINLRGSVVPVVDLAVKFGLPETPVTRRTCIVVVEVNLEGEATVMGLTAESVSEVVDLRAEDIEAAPTFGTRVKVEFLRGLGKVRNDFVLILDIDRLLSAEEFDAVKLAERETAEAGEQGGADESSKPTRPA